VQRGKVPEQPIGEMKNGLQADRLSACGFRVNAFRWLVHTLAYALVVLFREAVAAVPEVATARVRTLRQRLWQLGAVVVTGVRRICLHVSETWPERAVWGRVLAAVQTLVDRRQRRSGPGVLTAAGVRGCGTASEQAAQRAAEGESPRRVTHKASIPAAVTDQNRCASAGRDPAPAAAR
jgi:hypothetical protein